VGAGAGSSSGLSSLARPVDNSAPSTVTTSELVNAKPLHTVTADYPELAKSRRISGMVVVKVTVGKDGKVRNPVFVSGPLIFRDSAFNAVKQWVFQPAQLNGQSIDQETEIRMNFRPSN
jgi:periplasmic protein TonB